MTSCLSTLGHTIRLQQPQQRDSTNTAMGQSRGQDGAARPTPTEGYASLNKWCWENRLSLAKE